jgi:heat shock protein HslJ
MSALKIRARVVAVASGLALTALAAACSQPVTAPSPAAPSAPASTAVTKGSVWKLESLTAAGSPTVAVAAPDRFTFELVDGGRISARADCNMAMGGYSGDAATLTVGPMAVTKAYCSSAPLDDDYLRLLIGTNTATESGSSLVLSSARGTLRFRR